MTDRDYDILADKYRVAQTTINMLVERGARQKAVYHEHRKAMDKLIREIEDCRVWAGIIGAVAGLVVGAIVAASITVVLLGG